MAQINIPSSGLWSTIASALNSMFSEIFGRTGWAQYGDTIYDVNTPFNLPANTDTVLPNNAGNTIDSQKPVDVVAFYDSGLITGRSGDSLDIMIYFKAKSSTVDQFIDVWIDIGGAVGELYKQTYTFPKGQATERGIMYSLASAYTLGTWEQNGGTVYVRSNASAEIYDISFNFDRTHKAR